MIAKKIKTTSNFLNTIIEDLNNFSLSYISSSLYSLEGFLSKQSINKSKKHFYYHFISLDHKYLIMCMFKSINEQLTEGPLYHITIEKYVFDFILRSTTTNELEFNTILYIHSYTLNDCIESIDQKQTQLININKEETIKTISSSLYNQLIKKVVNQYNSAFPLNDFSASHFIQKNFKVDASIITPTLFEIIKKVYQLSNNCDGILLRQRLGIDYSFKYIIDNNQETNDILTNINWNELIITTSTLQEKQKEIDNPFTPSPVLFKEFSDKVINQEKKSFLGKKLKRDRTTEEEKKYIPQQVNELISYYGDINVNIGSSMIEKYLLFQKYTNLARKANIIKTK